MVWLWIAMGALAFTLLGMLLMAVLAMGAAEAARHEGWEAARDYYLMAKCRTSFRLDSDDDGEPD